MSVLVVWRCEGDREDLFKRYVTRRPVAHEPADPDQAGVVLIDLWESEEEFRRLSRVPLDDVIGVYEADAPPVPAS